MGRLAHAPDYVRDAYLHDPLRHLEMSSRGGKKSAEVRRLKTRRMRDEAEVRTALRIEEAHAVIAQRGGDPED